MKIKRGRLQQIIREELTRVLSEADSDGDGSLDADELRDLADKLDGGTGGGLSAEFDGEDVMLNGKALDQEELAREVSSDDDWDDNFDRMGAFAAKALKLNHGVVTVTDYEQPGKAWTVDDFIELQKSIAAEYDED